MYESFSEEILTVEEFAELLYIGKNIIKYIGIDIKAVKNNNPICSGSFFYQSYKLIKVIPFTSPETFTHFL